MGKRGHSILSLAIVLLFAGCAEINAPLNKGDEPAGVVRAVNNTRAGMPLTIGNGDNNDGYFVGLALSGGGSRSANFAAACMFELEQLRILQHVDCISAVSGGSLAGAYYCLYQDEWNTANVQKKLTHSFANDIVFTVLQPWNLFALAFSSWDRTDILADSFQKTLFSQSGRALKFADLRADRPHLLINATDLQSGRRFVFSNDSFDALNSDLSSYPIANAVAASAAVPVLLHHMTLRDYSTVFKRYRHLLDGGINDNLGVTSLVESYARQVKAAADANRPHPYPRGMVLLVVNANTNFDSEVGEQADVGLLDSLAAGAGLSTTALLNRVSSATLAELIVAHSRDSITAAELRGQIKQLEDTGLLSTRDRDDKPVRIVHMSLSHVGKLTELPFLSFGQRVNSIATYFNIAETEAYHLYKAAELLVRDEEFAKSLQNIAQDLNPKAAESK